MDDKRAEDQTVAWTEEGAIASGQGAVAVGKAGLYVGGAVGGDVLAAGARKIILTAEQAYQVHGLKNPYLGLRSFTYDDRLAFAGRDAAIQKALAKLTHPALSLSLLFVAGASGCGKSSFVQAGLIPALEKHYAQRHITTQQAVFRPSTLPFAFLADALIQLGLPRLSNADMSAFTSKDLNNFLAEYTPSQQVNLLVIDQFEESFTQTFGDQRQSWLNLLEGLADFSTIRTHVIATLRSDYLEALFRHARLWQIAKQGIELRAMAHGELKMAIQQPLYAAGDQDERYLHKRFEPALLERLAEDAAQDPAYLPLLQVSLLELWNGSSLVMEGYGSLSDAIRQRAEIVYAYEDYDSSVPDKPRSRSDKIAMMEIFTDLVEVSLSNDSRRDVRRRRLISELVGDSVQRGSLVNSLVNARLLSINLEMDGDRRIEVVDIIHEALIANWSRLRQAVASQRQTLQQRVRFEEGLREWLGSDCQESYLLRGIRLAEANELKQADDIALRSTEACKLLDASNALANQQLAFERQALKTEKRVRRQFQALAVILGLLLFSAIAVMAYPTVLSWMARGPLTTIPAGEVSLGTEKFLGDNAEDGPLTWLYLPAYQIERYEVTNRQYHLCVQAGKCSVPSDPQNYEDSSQNLMPVTNITAIQAAQYCDWIGRKLPSEAQWERTARGASSNDWPWGNAPLTPQRANLNFNKSTELIPLAAVNQFQDGQSEEGVFNLIGNVSEWTSSYRQDDGSYNLDDRWSGDTAVLEFDRELILRGGDREISLENIRSTAREFYPATWAWESIGFRCVLENDRIGP